MITDKKKKFAEAYLTNEQNSTHAAITAGYSEKTARVQGSRLLQDVDVKALLQQGKRKVEKVAEKKLNITFEWRLNMLKKVAEAGMETYSDVLGNARRENLAATKGAIEALNAMLPDDEQESGETLTYVFNVSEAKSSVVVTNAKP